MFDNYTRCGVLNEVLQPSYTNFISSPAIIRYSYPPLFGVVVIPALVVVLSLEDEEGGASQPAALTAAIRVIHSRSPAWRPIGFSRISEAVTTLIDAATPIWNPVSSKL
jgi:hypothetical protein